LAQPRAGAQWRFREGGTKGYLQFLPAHNSVILQVDLVGNDNHGEFFVTLLANLNKKGFFPVFQFLGIGQ